jgi:hypothetical protein
MAYNVGDSVVERDGVAGIVVSKYFGTVPSEVTRPLGYWEASNNNQIDQWYLTPNTTKDSERNSGKDTEAYTPPAGADWSEGREHAPGGVGHDGVPYTMYGVKRLEGVQPRGFMEETSEETITGFQTQRTPAITATGVSSKLNHPFIP